MKHLFILTLIGLFFLPVTMQSQNVWVNSDQDAIIKKIVITPDNSDDPLGNLFDPLNIYAGIINITWNNGTISTASLQSVNNSLLFGGLTFADASYRYFATYYCNDHVPLNVCHGIALKLVNGKLCVDGFQYNELATNFIVSVYSYGCFSNAKSLESRPTRVEIGILQKLTKAQLIDLLLGKKPSFDWPKGPVCLSCPPWPEFNKDLELRLKNIKIKKYQIILTEIK